MAFGNFVVVIVVVVFSGFDDVKGEDDEFPYNPTMHATYILGRLIALAKRQENRWKKSRIEI